MEYCLETKGLTKHFGANRALENVNLTVAPGRVVGLLGPNGSGKTTLIKLANGLLTPTAGELRICGALPGKETHAVVSYLPDRCCLPEWMSAEQLMDFYDDFYDDFDRARAADMMGRLGLHPEMKVGQMSKGTKEKVQLILVMSRRARLYLLDRNYDENASVIISTHLISDVESVLDDVIFLREGQVTLQASVDDIREQYGKSVDALFREVFRC